MSILKKILFVVNPISGDLDKKEMQEVVFTACKARNITLEKYTTTGKNDVEAIQAKVSVFQPDRILVAGGDGTIQLLAKASQGMHIPIGILPAGSANGLAVNLKLPETIEEQLEIAFGNHFLSIDLLQLNDEICIHIADLGVNAELIKKFKHSTIRGKLGYALQTIPALFSSEYPFTFVIETNGGQLEKKGVVLAIANAKKYGTGATINPKGKLNDGLFELVVFKSLDVINILKTLNEKVVFDTDFVEVFSCRRAIVDCEKPVPFQIDGEYYGKTKHVSISLCPEKMILMVPEVVLYENTAL